MALRVLLTLASLATAACLTPASAYASPPEPVDTETGLVSAGIMCDFDVLVTSSGKAGFIGFPHHPKYSFLLTAPGFRSTIANAADPLKSTNINATGVFRFHSVADDGSTEVFATGQNYWYLPEIGVTLTATTGPVTVIIGADGFVTSLDLSRASHVVDVCAAIS